jgi:hypothetical protein
MGDTTITISTTFTTTSSGTAPGTGLAAGGPVTGTPVTGGLVELLGRGSGLVTATRVTGDLAWARGPGWDGLVWRRFRPDPTSTTAQGYRTNSPAVTGWLGPAGERREPPSGREALRADLERDPMRDLGCVQVWGRKQDQGVNPSK